MARISKIHFSRWMVLVFIALWLGGCTASMQARSAFDEAEHLAAEEEFDLAVEKYFEAAQLEPSRKKYKLKLIASRTLAAANHVKNGRFLTRQGKYQEALAEYRLAGGFDPSIEVAAQEAKELRTLLEAQKFAEDAAVFYQKREITLSRKAINKALKLDSSNARALAIKGLLEKETHIIAMDGIDLDIASDEPITLRFQEANIKEVFGILSKLTGINFIFDEEIRDPAISVFLENASFAQAMELILQMNGLDKKVLNSRTIIIYPETREKDKQYDDQIIQTFYLSHIDAKKAVNLLRTMLQLRKVYVHEERNALVVRDTPEVIRLAEQILEAADRENSEVLYALEIVSVSNTDDLQLGPEISTYATDVGFAKESGGKIVSQGLESGDLTDNLLQSLNGLQTYYTLPTATFHYAKTLAETEILANPKIRVRNREKAKVHIGSREPVISVTQNNDIITDNIQYVDIGVKVDVEPNIQLNNTVETKLKLEVSQILERLPATASGSTPLRIGTTNAETVLTLRDGVQTIIGGLFEQIETSSTKTIPIIGDIPLLGSLFTYFKDNDQKREILLSITPYIIKQVEVPGEEVATIWSGGEDNLKAGANFGAFAQPLRSDVEAVRPMAAPSLKKTVVTSDDTEKVVLAVPATMLASSSMQLAEELPQELPAVEELEPVEKAVAKPEKETVPAEPAKETVPAEPAKETVPAEPAKETVPPEPTPEQLTVPEKVLASSAMQPAESQAPAVTAVNEEEIIATEQLPNLEVVGAPMVLEMPAKKDPALVFSGLELAETGKEFTFAVEVRDIEKLYSAPLFINYDPTMLELVSINEGSFLKQDGQTTVFSSSPNRTTGQVIVGYKQGAGGTGASGSGTLFNLNFRPKAAGETKVEINRVNFRNPEGVRLQVTPGVATIEVR